MKKVFAMFVVLGMLLMVTACAEGTVFNMGFDAEYPPYSYMDENGEYAGYDIDMCRKVCDILGWEIELVPINWDTKLIALDAGEIDCIWSGLTIDVLDPEAYTLSMAYSNSSQMILTKNGNGIETLADLEGKLVGVQLGTSADLLLSKGGDCEELTATFADLVRYENYNVCFTELMAGAIDAVAIDIGVAAEKISVYGDEYFMVEEPIAAEQYGICFRKADTEMCAAVEDAFMQLVEDGTYISLAEEYGLDTTALCLKAAE